MFFRFLIIAHFLSMLGTALTGYGIALWYLGQRGAISGYSLLAFCAVAPGIVFAPFAGVWIDRFDRRVVMLFGHGCAALCSMAIIVLYSAGQLTLWAILPFVMISSASNAVLSPAFIAVASQVVRKKNLTRVSGLMGIVQAMILIVIPPLAALLINWNGLRIILTIDVFTFIIALTTLTFIRLPGGVVADEKAKFWLEFRAGLEFISTRPALRSLIGFFWAMALSVAAVNVLLPPLVLSFGTTANVAAVLAAGGVGILLGGLTLALWGGPDSKVQAIIGFSFLGGMTYLLVLLPAGLWSLMLAAVLVMFCHAMVMGCNQVLWQHKVPLHLQGRVFSIASAVAFSAIPVGYLSAGLLAEFVFEPWMAGQSASAQMLVVVLGDSPGRGIAVMIGLIGLAMVIYSGSSMFRPVLINIERDLPDQLPDQLPGQLPGRSPEPMSGQPDEPTCALLIETASGQPHEQRPIRNKTPQE